MAGDGCDTSTSAPWTVDESHPHVSFIRFQALAPMLSRRSVPANTLLWPIVECPRPPFQCSNVAIHSQTGDNRLGLVTQIAVMAKRFPCMHVADVQLDEWYIHAQQCVSDGHRGVRIGSRIDDDAMHTARTGFMDAVDDGAFVVGLEVR